MSADEHLAQPRDRLSRWVHEHGRAVRGYLRALVGRPDEADDLVQEVFRRAWQARDRYEETGAGRAYLLRIADRLVMDWRRKRRAEINVDQQSWEQFEPADGDAEPPDLLARDEAARQLAAALERLSPLQRRVLLLRYYGDMTFAQIAEALNCPLNTVLSHGHRGLQTLRKLLVDVAP